MHNHFITHELIISTSTRNEVISHNLKNELMTCCLIYDWVASQTKHTKKMLKLGKVLLTSFRLVLFANLRCLVLDFGIGLRFGPRSVALHS